ncbi:MAG: hypothetical protein V3S20_09450, partial [Dehalococcoidia bacterium]
ANKLQLCSDYSISTNVMGKFTVLILSVFVFFAFVLGVSAQTDEDEPLPAELESCLRAALGDERFEALSFGQTELTAEEISRTEPCFVEYYDVVPNFMFPPDTTYDPDEYFPPEVIECLINAVGEERSYAFDSDQAELTAEELSKVQACLQEFDLDPGPLPDSRDDKDLSDDVIDCLIDAVGEERFRAIEPGQSEPTPEEMALGEHCFETYSGPVPLPPPDAALPEPVGMSPELIECLESVFGEERFQAISTGQSGPTPEEMGLGDQCFRGYAGPDYDGAQPLGASPDIGLDPWLEACLIEAVGDERFDAISSGQSQPTAVEEQLGNSCFAKLGYEQPIVVSSPDGAIETEVIQCLKLAMGEERFGAIAEGLANPTLVDRDKAEKCFGSVPGPISPPPQVILDESFIDCLINAVGEERFQAISLGESQPTPEEGEAGAACFRVSQSEGGLSPDVILPLPSDQIPYLPENPDAISVDDISQEDDDDSTDDTETATIKGTAPPGEVVDIYVHSSTAVVVSTEADSSGKWSYTVLGLEEGPHLVYAAARVDGETERSVGTTFQVGAGGGTNWVLWGLGGVAAILVMRILWGGKRIGATIGSPPPA